MPAADAAERSPLDLAGLNSLLGFRLRRAQSAFHRHFTTALSGVELTQKQVAVLWMIEANPGVSQIDLANLLEMDRATIMAIVDRLEKRELAVRRRSTSDRRRQELYVTDAGRRLLSEAKAAIAAHEQHFAARFPPETLKVLREGLLALDGASGLAANRT